MSLSEDIKTLREQTGAGMLDCKKAIEQNNGDMNKAADWLREQGIHVESLAIIESLDNCEIKFKA